VPADEGATEPEAPQATTEESADDASASVGDDEDEK
jgi:hypothetical protein